MNLLTISGSPHIHSGLSVKRIMWGVVIAMLPALVVSVYYFGLGAIKVSITAVLACLLFEYVINKYLLKKPNSISDGSAVITGLLLAFNLPSNLPIWMIIIGAFVAIGIAKMSFGGLGNNPFNPALVARVFMLISFPVNMTSWPVPNPITSFSTLDAITGPTPLGIIREGGNISELPSYLNMFIGNMGGSLGEVSALALLIGGIYMLFKKIITWHIPISFIGSAVLFSGILYYVDPTKYVDPIFHILAGGMILGAIFMATDMVTSPMTHKGQLIFGIGCGLITILIRVFGSFPEGVSFAILIMNGFTPLINKLVKPKRFGDI